MTQETASSKVLVGKEVNTISLKKAQQWAKRWRDKESSYNKHHELNAFLIPRSDLAEVLAEKGSDQVRAYIGVEKIEPTVNGGEPTYVEKLMFVATKLNPETGIYEDLIGGVSGSLESTLVADSIYDFTEPCPPAGDPKSPLNV